MLQTGRRIVDGMRSQRSYEEPDIILQPIRPAFSPVAPPDVQEGGTVRSVEVDGARRQRFSPLPQ